MEDGAGAARVVVWAAVSTEAQVTGEEDSLDRQVRDGREWAADVGGQVVRVLRVPGHTRKFIFYQDAEHEMPAYARLRELCESETFDVLWCRERSRLGRTDALISQVEALVQQAGAEVYSSLMPHALGQSEVSAIFTGAVERAMAQSENVQRTRWHAAGMRARVRRGLPPGSWPYGYAPMRDAKGRTVGAEFGPEIEAVQLITRRFLEGKGYSAIAKELNRSRWQPIGGRVWWASTVHTILHNDTYAGYPAYAEASYRDRERGPSDRYPPLWDEETHLAVVRERGRRKRGGRAFASPLSTRVFCARCGAAMSIVRWRGRASFRCTTHSHKAVTGISCHPNAIREDVVVAAAQAFLDELARRHPGELERMAEEASDGRAGIEAERDGCRVALADVERQQTRLALAVAAGTIDPLAARRANDELSDRARGMREALAEAQARLDALPSSEQRAAALGNLRELPPLAEADKDEARRALADAGFRVWVGDKEIVKMEIGVA